MTCRTPAALVVVGAIASALAAPHAFAHGASRGLHLHLSSKRAAAGSTITVSVHAAEPLREIEASVVGGAIVKVRLVEPRRAARFELVVPDDARGRVNVHAEAVTTTGKTRRASAIMHVDESPPDPPEATDDTSPRSNDAGTPPRQ